MVQYISFLTYLLPLSMMVTLEMKLHHNKKGNKWLKKTKKKKKNTHTHTHTKPLAIETNNHKTARKKKGTDNSKRKQ